MERRDDAPLAYDEKTLKQLEDDDPGISFFQALRKLLPLVHGFGGKLRALFLALLRVLP